MAMKPEDVGVIAGIERCWRRIFVSCWKLFRTPQADHSKYFVLSIDPGAPPPRWCNLDGPLGQHRAEIRAHILVSNNASSPMEIIWARVRCATRIAVATMFPARHSKKLRGGSGSRRTIAPGQSASFELVFLLDGVEFVPNEVARAVVDVSDSVGHVQRLLIKAESD